MWMQMFKMSVCVFSGHLANVTREDPLGRTSSSDVNEAQVRLVRDLSENTSHISHLTSTDCLDTHTHTHTHREREREGERERNSLHTKIDREREE